MTHRSAEYPDDSTPPISLNPKSRITLPLLVLAGILTSGFYAGQYVTKLVSKVEATATLGESHTVQLMALDQRSSSMEQKIDQFIYMQNERAKWQNSSLRAIAQKVGANTYPLPVAPDEQPK